MVKSLQRFFLPVVVCAAASTVAMPAYSADAEVAALRAEIARLSERLNALESKDEADTAAPAVLASTAPATSRDSNATGVKIKGDFRYRYEFIDQQGSAERYRNRIRARVGLSGNVNDNVSAGIELATGGDDPTSRNQTLDGGFSSKDFGLDLAFVTWRATQDLAVTAGKMKNPMHRAGGNGLLWDSDLNPEGIAFAYSSGPLFVNAAGLFVDERSSAKDSLLLGGQAGFDADLDGMNLKAGFGYFAYTNTQGNSPFYDGDARGNTVDAGGDLVNDYKMLELFAELGAELGEMPVKVFVDWVQNTEVSQFDTAYAFGVKLGKASAPGTWDAAWIYQDIESDAMIATFTDSDFGGGGTDVKGHLFKASYSVAKNWTAALTYFLNEFGENAGAKTDYQRVQADLQFKF